jgi:hypothetical protein
MRRAFTTFTCLRVRRQAHRMARQILHPPINPTIVPPLPAGGARVDTKPPEMERAPIAPLFRAGEVPWVGNAVHDLKSLVRLMNAHRIWVGAAIIFAGSALNLYYNWGWF